MGATFLVCHGAWSAGWAWKKMHPLMAAGGHRLVTPTCTGLGERAHLANRRALHETSMVGRLLIGAGTLTSEILGKTLGG